MFEIFTSLIDKKGYPLEDNFSVRLFKVFSKFLYFTIRVSFEIFSFKLFLNFSLKILLVYM